MTTKHTPGPWVQAVAQIIMPASKIRGDGTSTADGICQVWDTSDEGKANARLIAAAPELLEALRVFVDFPDDAFAGKDGDWYTMSVSVKDMRAARAAIAKAEGNGGAK